VRQAHQDDAETSQETRKMKKLVRHVGVLERARDSGAQLTPFRTLLLSRHRFHDRLCSLVLYVQSGAQ
jgi:hypothetical protein